MVNLFLVLTTLHSDLKPVDHPEILVILLNVNHHAYETSIFIFDFYISLFFQELARENSFRDRENAKDSLRKTTSATGSTNPSNTVSRESSRNVSPESSKTSKIENNPDAPFDEEKTRTHVHSLIEEYTENYSDNTDRPVNVSQPSIFDDDNNNISDIFLGSYRRSN